MRMILKKKLSVSLCLLLTICTVLGGVSQSGLEVQAAEADENGFVIDENGVLTSYKGSGGDVVIPSSVTSIEDSAFRDCSGLKSITIPSSVTSIEGLAFYGCSGLERINVAEGNERYNSKDNCNAIIEKTTNTLIAGCKNTIIPEGVTSIGSYTFSSF